MVICFDFSVYVIITLSCDFPLHKCSNQATVIKLSNDPSRCPVFLILPSLLLSPSLFLSCIGARVSLYTAASLQRMERAHERARDLRPQYYFYLYVLRLSRPPSPLQLHFNAWETAGKKFDLLKTAYKIMHIF